jgi:hypothetical protein
MFEQDHGDSSRELVGGLDALARPGTFQLGRNLRLSALADVRLQWSGPRPGRRPDACLSFNCSMEPMKTILRNILAIIAGLVAGGVVNMALIVLGPHVIPPPPGVDPTDVQSLSASIHLLGPQHFVFPFLAHALGTLAGAIVCFRIAATYRASLAYAIGAAFLAGGISAAWMIPAPIWFIVLDLVGAYIPMAWIGILLIRRTKGRTNPIATAETGQQLAG